MSKKTIRGLDSYHSQYPMSYYEEGVAYAFYHHINIAKLEFPATEEQLTMGVEALKIARDSFGFEEKELKGLNFEREIGVVVGKKEATNKNFDEIIVLFERNGEYVTRLYVVDYRPGVFLDGKEWNMATPDKNLKSIMDEVTGPIEDEVTGPVEDEITGPVTDEATGPVAK